MATSDGPITPRHVTLTVRDASAVAAFYKTIVGLADRPGSDGEIALGTASSTLLILREDAAAPARPEGSAGLYHTAFLLPQRGDLAAWLNHARAQGITLTGKADHLVSEALYLDDPEGNGIEIYADRPRETWTYDAGAVEMANDPIDLDALATSATAPWQGAPEGTVVGHIHFKVGDVVAAEAFWRDRMGFALMRHWGKAGFLGSGGYHHHIGVNTWHSEGAGNVPAGTGLAGTLFDADGEAFDRIAERNGLSPQDGVIELADPHGIAITVMRTG